MTKFSQKVLAALSAGTMLLSVVSPVLADTTLEISGNGADSVNNVNLTQSSTTTVVQSNSANISNDVDASATTGGNDANRNTGGSITIDTGNARTDVAVSNAVNSNTANVDCCSAGDTSVLISGNGADSVNGVTLDQGSKSGIDVYQDNNAHIRNDVDARASTGRNDASSNTGGDVEVFTGDATTKVLVSNTANANWAMVGGGSQNGSGLVNLRILGNGADSVNTIDLDLDRSILLAQSNSARIYNDVDAKAETGKNDANRNTGGEVTIDTGNAKVDVDVDNAVNFNYASVDCGCLLDVSGKIAGNGVDSVNTLRATLGSDQLVFQDNCGESQASWELESIRGRHGCKLDNDVDAKASSGKNDVESNTGTPNGGDPSVNTGNAESDVDVSNSGNANAFGVSSGFEWPTFDFNFNIGGWSVLWALFGHN